MSDLLDIYSPILGICALSVFWGVYLGCVSVALRRREERDEAARKARDDYRNEFIRSFITERVGERNPPKTKQKEV